MRDSEFAALVEQIETLTKDQRKRLLASITPTSEETNPFSHDGQIMYDALIEATGVRIKPAHLVQQVGGNRAYHDKVHTMFDFIAPSSTLLRETQRRGLVAICIKCLATYLEAKQLEVMPDTLVKHMNYLGRAVDRAYPGYAKAKMLHMLVRAQA